MSQRKAFNFYKSYLDVYEELKTDKEKAQFIDALLKKQFYGVEPTNLKGMVKFAYVSQKEVIDKQIKGWEDKTGNKLSTPSQGGLSTPSQQEKEEEKEQEQVKPIVKRKELFRKELQEYYDNNRDKYPKQLYIDFYKYWSEHGSNDKKMRYEKESSFGLSRRLSTWYKNDFNGEYKKKEKVVIDPKDYFKSYFEGKE